MERHYILSSDMTSNNINKIMRSNLHLNSKILSKNTTEILNTCVGKLYKQMPITFQRSLHQGKTINATKSENRAPIERLAIQNRLRWKPGKTNIYEDQMLNRLMNISKKSNGQIQKKASKTPGFKIYNSKRYCSSNSSSSGSIFNRNDDRSRSMRNYHTHTRMSFGGKSSTHKSPVKPGNAFSSVTPARNQYMSPSLSTWQYALKVSSDIQKDLMSVDEALKTRLNNITKPNAEQETNDGTNSVPLKVLSKALKLQTTEVQRTLSTTELQTKVSSKKLVKQSKDLDNSTATVKAVAQKLKLTHSLPSKASSYLQLPKQQQLNQSTPSQSVRDKSLESFKFSNKHQNSSASVPTLDISTPKNTVQISTKKRRYTLRNCVPPSKETNPSNLEDERHHKPVKGSGKSIPPSTYCLTKPNSLL